MLVILNCALCGLTYAGQLKFDGVPVDITTTDNEDLVIAPGSGGKTQIGVGAGTDHHARTQNDLFITGILESSGATYLDSLLTVAGALTANGNVTLGDSASDTITTNGVFSVTKNASTGDEVAYNFGATINKAVSGNYTGLKLDVTETSAPGLADKLLDLQVGGASRLQVYNGDASANYGLLSLGSGAWDGSTSGHFNGSPLGTLLALNAPDTFSGNLMDLQVGGASRCSVSYDGTITYSGTLIVGGNIVPSQDSTYSLGSASAAWRNLYTDTVRTVSGTNLTILPTSGYTIIGDSSSAAHALANGDLFVSGVLESGGAAYLDGNTTLGDASTDSVTVNASVLSLVNASTLNLADSSVTGLNIESGLLDLDTAHSRVGIGTTAPDYNLQVTGTLGIGSTAYFAGNVGIGTTSPAYELDVTGDIRTTGNVYAPSGGSTQGYWKLTGSSLYPTSTSYNVGIGTTTPANKLDVEGNLAVGASYSGATPAPENGAIIQGNVGIGTTGPAAKLDVTGTANISASNTTGNSLTLSNNSLTSGTLFSKSLASNAGNSQSTTGESLSLTDNTSGTGGYTVLSVSSVASASAGSGNKYLLSLNPGLNNEVVFDSTGAFRPTTSYTTNTASLGTALYRFKSAYIDTVDANNISGTVVTGSTSSPTWTIGSTETGDTYKAVVFQRNSGSGNAALQWNVSGGTANQRYLTVNYPFNSTYTVSDTSIGTDISLFSGDLANSTTTGTQKMLALKNSGSGVTENGIYIENTAGAATGLAALEVSGAWNNGLIVGPGSGNVGIGTTSPAYDLDVTGDIRVTGSVYAPSGGSTQGYWKLSGSTLYPISTGYNVGIGTTSPAQKLDVTGTIQATGFKMPTGAQNTYALVSDANGVGAWTDISYTGGPWTYSGSPNYYLYPDDYANAKVGIGTSSPEGKLHVSMSGTNTNYSYFDASSLSGGTTLNSGLQSRSYDGSSITSKLTMYGTGNTWTYGGYAANAGVINAPSTGGLFLGSNNASGGVMFFTGGDVNTKERMRITNGGNVGIGTTSPSEKLQVSGGVKIAGAATTNLASSLTIDYITGTSISRLISQGADTSTNGKISLLSSRSDGSNSLTILASDTNGNVGIGTTSPESPLHVQTTSTSITNPLILEGDRNTVDTEVGILFKDRSAISGGQEASRIWTDRSGSTGNFDLVFQAGSQSSAGLQAESIRIQGLTGYVGIGTTSPAYELDVTGDIRTTGNVYAPSGGSTQGYWKLTGSSLYPTSTGYNVGIGTTSPQSDLQIGSLTSTSTASPITLSLGGTYSSTAGANPKFKLYDIGGSASYGFGISNASLDSMVPTSANFKWYVNGSQKMILNSSGYLGIGTASPGLKFEIGAVTNGSPASSGTSQTGGFRMRGDSPLNNTVLDSGIGAGGGTNAWFQATNAANLSLNYNILLNPNGGNVGIGTTTPEEKLAISGSNADLTTSQVSVSNIAINAKSSGIKFITTTTTGTASVFNSGRLMSVFDGTSYSTARITLQTPTGVDTWVDTLTAKNGNVGIGTTNPAYRLDLADGSYPTDNDAIVRLGVSNTVGVEGGGIIWSPNYPLYTKISAAIRSVSEGNYFRQGLAFYTGNNSDQTTNATEKMRINMDGYVGIGTTAPAYDLDVAGDIRTTGSIYAPSGGSTQGYWKLTGSYLYPTSTGYNVGIGVTNPTQKLTVTGSVDASVQFLGQASDTITAPSFSWTGDTNVGMYRPTTDTIAFTTAGTEKVRLTSGGYLGIGTTGPSSGLQVSNGGAILGSKTLTANDQNDVVLFSDSAGSAAQSGAYYNKLKLYGGSSQTRDLQLWQQVTEYAHLGSSWTGNKLYIDSSFSEFDVNSAVASFSGNVGVGTTSPKTALEVSGDIMAGTNNKIGFRYSGVNDNFYNYMTANGAGPLTLVGGKYTSAATTVGINLETYNGTAVSVLNGGNVGIGTTNPAGILHIVDSSGPVVILDPGTSSTADPHLRIADQNASTVAGLDLWYDNNVGSIYFDSFYNSSTGDIYFRTKTAGTPVYAMMIESAGNVGIGTTTPTQALTVAGSVDSSVQFLGQASDTITAPSFSWTGDTNVGMYRPTTDTIAFTTAGTEKVRLTSGGYLGIGTTSPGYQLDVSGDIRAIGKIYLNTSLGQGSGAHGISWYSPAYYTWYDYMAPGGSTNAPSGAAAPTDSSSGVTSWARRFNMENQSTYGWIFESGTNVSGNAPTVKFSINSATGTFHSIGNGIIGGNVGIGTTAPAYDLDVTGDIRVTGSVYAPSGGSTQGYWKLTGSSLYPTS
ncbi:MAG: hypothetical protein V1869_04695, partial [Candidatus Omnitrophota bacterium]